MRKIMIILAVFGLLVGAQAATQEDTATFSLKPDGSATFNLDKYVGNAADLQSVIFSVSYTKTGGFAQADNDSTNSGNITFNHTVLANLRSDDVNFTDDNYETFGLDMDAVSSSGEFYLSATTGDDTGSFDKTVLGDYAEWNPSGASFVDSWSLNSIRYDQVAGGGTFSVGFEAYQTLSVVGFGGTSQASTPSDVAGSTTVSYEYIPEPAAAGMIAVVVALIAWIRRRFAPRDL